MFHHKPWTFKFIPIYDCSDCARSGNSAGCLTVNSGECFNGVQTLTVPIVQSIEFEKSDAARTNDISNPFPYGDIQIHRSPGECMTAIKLYSTNNSGTFLNRMRFYFEPIQGVGQNVLVPDNHLFPDGKNLVFEFVDQWTYWSFMGILMVIVLTVLVAAYCLFIRSRRNRKGKYQVVAVGTESDLEADALRR